MITFNNLLSQERLKTIRDKIERYYYQYAFVINSDVLDSRYNYNVAHSNGNSYSTVAIPLPDGTYLYSLLTHQNAYDDPVLNVLDSIKIDGVMWKNAPELVKALKEITDKKGIKLIAEKVETKKELNKLLDLGITHFQGWYFNGVDNN